MDEQSARKLIIEIGMLLYERSYVVASDGNVSIRLDEDRVLATPRKPHPDVAFDFWDQVDRAEELDEIKAHRPSAFLALPPEPGLGIRESEGE